MAEAPVLADSARRLGIRVVALVVDSRAQPALHRAETLRVDELWWDAQGVWRHRWGHRLYGELMRFDAEGRLLDGPDAGRGSTRGLARPREEGR
jgi:hypothetical protein